MSKAKWLEVNRTEEAVTLDVGALCSPSTISEISPIDEYYDHARTLLLKSVDPAFSGDQWLMRLLLLGLVSATETYFRRILAALVLTCPLSRRHALVQNLALGAVYYYPSQELGYALLEDSMSGSKNIKNETRNLTGIDVNSASVTAALAQFDIVCNLRHAAVHSQGELNARNARDVGLTPVGRHSLNLTPLTFQSLVSVCHNVVRAYNRFLLSKTLDRWIGADLMKGEWKADRELFSPVYKLFFSKRDGSGYQRPYDAYTKFKRHVLE